MLHQDAAATSARDSSSGRPERPRSIADAAAMPAIGHLEARPFDEKASLQTQISGVRIAETVPAWRLSPWPLVGHQRPDALHRRCQSIQPWKAAFRVSSLTTHFARPGQVRRDASIAARERVEALRFFRRAFAWEGIAQAASREQ